MVTDDFFRARLDSMIDARHPLAVLTTKLPWPAIEVALSAKFAHQDRPAKSGKVDFDSTGLMTGISETAHAPG